MQATVLSVENRRLLVFDRERRQTVVVHTQDARRFRPGNLVCIRFSGAMTNSIPPQISAIFISRIPRFSPWQNRCR